MSVTTHNVPAPDDGEPLPIAEVARRTGLPLRLRDTGMSIADMQAFAQLRRKGDSSVKERLDLLSRHRDDVRARIRELRTKLRSIDKKGHLLRGPAQVKRWHGALLAGLLIGLGGCASEQPAAITSPTTSASAPGQAVHTGFSSPTGLAFGRDGTAYVSNWSGGTVERITPDGKRSTLAEVPSPSGVAVDEGGNVYVASYSGDVIYRVTPAGERREFATGFQTPAGISFDSKGNLLVCNRASDEILRVTPAGEVSRVTGGLNTPVGVIEGPAGDLYVANYVGGVVSRITTDGKVTAFSDDFDGLGVGMALDGSGRLYATDRSGGQIKRVERDGSTVPVMSGLSSPVALAMDPKGVLHAATWGDGALYRVTV
ncbi:virginiamycin B lyase family protein [Nonomuraea polychroma]|uniref:virginiamycin B lyase family protein n=1 Tax=Nonomuraea polychroma TaxID=46176 RepID=UPI003D8F91E5